jgi:hypothetical protein
MYDKASQIGALSRREHGDGQASSEGRQRAALIVAAARRVVPMVTAAQLGFDPIQLCDPLDTVLGKLPRRPGA